MIFTKYVDGDFVDQFKSTGSIDISESDLNKNDRLKSKLRSGVSIHSTKRAQILKKIILGDKPIVDEISLMKIHNSLVHWRNQVTLNRHFSQQSG